MKALLFAFMLCATLARADVPAELEAREAGLAAQLRCVVCQNQTVSESNAPLAADMRREIRAQLQAGSSDADVVAFFEQRYGAFVHYTPPLRPSTWLLWAGPFVGAAAGLAALIAVLRRRGRQPVAAPLSAVDKARAERLLNEEALR
jgi:cytochrome c-type biogenesis protein CcmH